MLGVELPLGERLFLAFETRYRDVRAFTAGNAYDALRSHPSNLRPDGSEPVAYRVGTDDLGGWGLGVGLTYRLGRER